MKNIFGTHSIFAKNGALIFLIRVGIACLGIATLLYIFFPTMINSFAESLSPRQALVNLIKDEPGFDQDWLSVASLITVSAYVYCYLAITLVMANLLYPPSAGTFRNSDGREQWRLLSYVIVGRRDVSSQASTSADYQSMPSIIRAYSKSREGIRSVVLDAISIVAVSYIGYTSLQRPPSHSGGLVARIIDALMVGLWCYCIFAIFMSLIFISFAWIQYSGRNA